MSYLLQDDPEVILWDFRDGAMQFIPWIRDSDLDCTLHDFQYSIGAKWHIGHKEGSYGLLEFDRHHARTLCSNLEQAVRLLPPVNPTIMPPVVIIAPPQLPQHQDSGHGH